MSFRHLGKLIWAHLHVYRRLATHITILIQNICAKHRCRMGEAEFSLITALQDGTCAKEQTLPQPVCK